MLKQDDKPDNSPDTGNNYWVIGKHDLQKGLQLLQITAFLHQSITC